jgi:hypothetical protein
VRKRAERDQICVLAVVFLFFCVNTVLALDTSPGAEHVFDLEYQPEGFNCSVPVDVRAEGEKFEKEPDFGGRDITRGLLLSGTNADQHTNFAWDQAEGKLYLDMNRNGDLTDDPNGVFENDRPGRGSYQLFRGIHLEVQHDLVRLPYVISVIFSRYGKRTPHCSAKVSSGFSGEAELYGRRWYVAIADGMDGVIQRDDQLFLSPLDDDETGHNQHSLPLAAKVFFDGRNYDLSFELQAGTVKPLLRVAFTESEVPMGRLGIEGKFIKLLVLDDGPAAVVLDSPEAIEPVPAGEYLCKYVFLDADESGLVRSSSPQSISVSVLENETATLKVGGPLSSTVDVTRMGNTLQLNYKLLDIGGHSYTSGQGIDKPPAFAIYKGGKEIASGSFEYG